jgi:hypothetical protein
VEGPTDTPITDTTIMPTQMRGDTTMLGTPPAPVLGATVPPIHILIIEPNGETSHWLVPLPKAEAAADALATAERLFPSSRTELHWRRAFGTLWAIVFISSSRLPTGQKAQTAPVGARSRYLPDPED